MGNIWFLAARVLLDVPASEETATAREGNFAGIEDRGALVGFHGLHRFGNEPAKDAGCRGWAFCPLVCTVVLPCPLRGICKVNWGSGWRGLRDKPACGGGAHVSEAGRRWWWPLSEVAESLPARPAGALRGLGSVSVSAAANGEVGVDWPVGFYVSQVKDAVGELGRLGSWQPVAGLGALSKVLARI
jgi:hypothetical protein